MTTEEITKIMPIVKICYEMERLMLEAYCKGDILIRRKWDEIKSPSEYEDTLIKIMFIVDCNAGTMVDNPTINVNAEQVHKHWLEYVRSFISTIHDYHDLIMVKNKSIFFVEFCDLPKFMQHSGTIVTETAKILIKNLFF